MKLTEEDIRAYNAGEPITYEPRNSGRDMNELSEFNRYRDFNFRKEKLYVQDVDTGVSVVPDLVHDKMFRVQWPDGVLSEDFYNFTMARENARVVADSIDLKVSERLKERFK